VNVRLERHEKRLWRRPSKYFESFPTDLPDDRQATTCLFYNDNKTVFRQRPPQVYHLDVVGRFTPSMNGNQEFTASRSLVRQTGPSRWYVSFCCLEVGLESDQLIDIRRSNVNSIIKIMLLLDDGFKNICLVLVGKISAIF
jgi:hypothetical protein